EGDPDRVDAAVQVVGTHVEVRGERPEAEEPQRLLAPPHRGAVAALEPGGMDADPSTRPGDETRLGAGPADDVALHRRRRRRQAILPAVIALDRAVVAEADERDADALRTDVEELGGRDQRAHGHGAATQ